MSPIGIGALIVSAIALVIVTALVPRLWRGQITTVTVRQYWWPGGDDSWMRFVRAWPVLFVGVDPVPHQHRSLDRLAHGLSVT